MRASAASFGVAKDFCTGCDAAAAAGLDCGAAWASAVRAHDRATTCAMTRDLGAKKLNVFDLMYFSLIMTTSAVRHPWTHRHRRGNPCWRIPVSCWLARCL